MTWVRRQANEPKPHTCDPPYREVEYHFPSSGLYAPPMPPDPVRMTVVDGQEGDLWRCDDCRELWRVGPACEACDRSGSIHGGMCTVGQIWRTARLWQVLKAWVTRR